MAKVYSPEDVLKKRVETIPDYVIDAFNDLLTENYHEDETIIEQEDVICKILEYSTDDELTRKTIFKKHYLDIENLYRNNGWEVEYRMLNMNRDVINYAFFIMGTTLIKDNTDYWTSAEDCPLSAWSCSTFYANIIDWSNKWNGNYVRPSFAIEAD